MVAVTAALIGFFAFVIMRVTTPQMTTLFTDLSVEDSSSIIKDLERQGIQFEIRNEGSIIMVPKDKVTRLRMKLAEGGLPKGGGVGLDRGARPRRAGSPADPRHPPSRRLRRQRAEAAAGLDRGRGRPAARR